jgi:hypothetical protein
MFNKSMVQYFRKYAIAHNKNSESKAADKTYDELYDLVSNNFDEDKTEYIMNTLCKIKNRKIDFLQNLCVLDESGISVDLRNVKDI